MGKFQQIYSESSEKLGIFEKTWINSAKEMPKVQKNEEDLRKNG